MIITKQEFKTLTQRMIKTLTQGMIIGRFVGHLCGIITGQQFISRWTYDPMGGNYHSTSFM